MAKFRKKKSRLEGVPMLILLGLLAGAVHEYHNWFHTRVMSAQKATSYDERRINAQEGRE
jgi:hypothetical protein